MSGEACQFFDRFGPQPEPRTKLRAGDLVRYQGREWTFVRELLPGDLCLVRGRVRKPDPDAWDTICHYTQLEPAGEARIFRCKERER